MPFNAEKFLLALLLRCELQRLLIIDLYIMHMTLYSIIYIDLYIIITYVAMVTAS